MFLFLRVLHVMSAAFWFGAAVFVSRFLTPSIKAAGSAGGPVMEQLTRIRKMPIWMMSSAVLTVLSGIGLYWSNSGGFTNEWMQSGPGRAFGIGGAFGILAAIIGIAGAMPVGRKLGAIGADLRARGTPPTPQEVANIAQLQAKLQRTGDIVAVLLVIAIGEMAVARYIQ
jgi:hypothetical protein